MRTELTYDTHKEMLQLHSYFIPEILQIILLLNPRTLLSYDLNWVKNIVN